MAEFAQSAASRQAMTDAARGYLADRITPSNVLDLAKAAYTKPQLAQALAGTTDKQSKAYKNALRNVQRWDTKGKEARKPNKASLDKLAEKLKGDPKAQKAAAAGAGAGKVHVVAGAFYVGGNPKYKRPNKSMEPLPFDDDDFEQFLLDAVDDPDEAWQRFFDHYVIPAGTIDSPQISFR